MSNSAIPVTVENPGEEKAVGAGVSAGVPFARSALKETTGLALAAADGRWVPLQTECLSKWPDGSCRWVLLDFAADVAAGSSADFMLKTSGENPAPGKPVTVTDKGSTVTLSNGLVEFAVQTDTAGGTLKSADGKRSVDIASVVEIGGADGRITSEVIVDSLDVYATGPLRAAVSLYGRRIYSNGIEGPFSQRVEMFAGSPYIRVEDTFIYAHFPGTHAKPANPLALWKVEAAGSNGARVDVVSLVDTEEAEGLVVSDGAVAFWGKDEPFDFSRYDDDVNIGEDCRGIALGVGKSCTLLVGLPEAKGAARPVGAVYAHTTPEVYAASGALGRIAPATPGQFEAAEEGIRQVMAFWMWFQDNDPDGVFGSGAWHGLFDWGDWQSRYADRKHNPTGWQYHEGRYGWDSNEMDTSLMIWSAFLHTGGSEYWRSAVAMARHVMDVDMIHVDYRDYDVPEHIYDLHYQYDGASWREGFDRMADMNTIGLGRRHNVQHWGEGVGDTRHGWNGGIMMYYYLTGNRRARDAVLAMADMHMQRMFGCSAGEYSVGMWCIYNAWQLSGEGKYIDEFRYRLALVDKWRLPDGCIAGHINFQDGTNYPEVNTSGGEHLDLILDYITNVLIDYCADTGDEVAKEILIGLARRNIEDEPTGPADFQRTDALRLLSWAYMETGDERFLERAKYHLSSLDAKPFEKPARTPDEWRDGVYEMLAPHDWDIRVVGPVVRMAPYAMKAIAESEKGGQ